MRFENQSIFYTLVHQLTTNSNLSSSQITPCGPGFNVRLSQPGGQNGRTVYLDYRPGIALHVVCMEKDLPSGNRSPWNCYSAETARDKVSYELPDYVPKLSGVVNGWIKEGNLPAVVN